MKSLNVVSWHHQAPERRALKRGRIGPPDVYPQELKQEEDNLGADRLKKGYQVTITSYEHDSIILNPKIPRLDRADDATVRSPMLFMQIMARKNELNANLDKEGRRCGKEVTFHNFSHAVGQAVKSKERKEWFTNLSRGKSLALLAKRPPFFRKKEDALEYLCDFKVPISRALWFLKLIAVGQAIASSVNKQKKSTADQLALEHSSLFSKYIKVMLTQMTESAKLDQNIVYTERWPYFVCICKHAYEDGLLDRQEFLMDLCDIFADRFVQRSDKPHFFTLFSLFLSFFAQYIDQFTQNLILARRCAFLVSRRLAIYKEEAEESSGRQVIAEQLFSELLHCEKHRSIILVLCGVLYAVLIDCPGALVWNFFRVLEGRPPAFLHQLCSSPLDHLPCDVEALPMPPGAGSDKIMDLLHFRAEEVKRRSQAVENRWSLSQTQKNGFVLLVNTCLEIIGVLDSFRYDRPNNIERMYNKVFSSLSKERFEHEHAIRVKVLLQWAVTAEREGTHRAAIVASLLATRINHRKGFRIGDSDLQDVLIEYLETEGPQPNQPHFHEEFSNLMHLFYELLRAGVFSHDAYVKELITTGELLKGAAVVTTIRERLRRKGEVDNGAGTFAFIKEEPEANMEISRATQPSMGNNSEENHPFLNSDLSVHERFLIHLPIPQIHEYRNECNQRLLLLYGMDEQRDNVKNELKKIAREIAKMWMKRIVVEFSFTKPPEIRFKKRANKEQIIEALTKFRSQTYYDQVVLCGWCCDNFVSMIRDFVEGPGTVLPTAEGLDILLNMMEECKNISGIMELAEELLPLLAAVEQVIAERRVDCVPSIISTQLGHVLTAYISHNYYYFLCSENAPEIVNGLYRIIESQLKSSDSCLTCWGRAIAIFILNVRSLLYDSGLSDKITEVNPEILLRTLPPQTSYIVSDSKYNAHLFQKLLDEPKRIFSFNYYRELNSSIDGMDARYSFVVSALLAARQCNRDYDRLVELANICGHVSAQAGISAEWCGAIRALCCTSAARNYGFTDVLLAINVEDSTCHYSISTFYMLLAARNCFSMSALIHELLQTALSTLLQCDYSKNDADAEAGICLALLVLAAMVCQNPEPIALPTSYTGENENKKSVMGLADQWILSNGHIHDIGDAIFDLLITICLLVDYTNSRLRDYVDDKSDRNFRGEYICHVSKATLIAMCEQDWVTHRVYKACEETNMEIFSSPSLRKNCVGQQLLRRALRRRCERTVVQELTVCNGNSKKSLIDKLFDVLTVWNIRATYFDLKLMMREILSDGLSKHAQQMANSEALIGEIGKSCRDLFTMSRKNDTKLPEAVVGKPFRLIHISKYWLISSLIEVCPKPLQSSTNVQSKFLTEATNMLDIASTTSKERIQSAWLLSQESFINLVLTCLKVEEKQRDGLVRSLLRQVQDLAGKTKEDPVLPYLEKFNIERESLLLRLSLLGGIFDSVSNAVNCESCALLLFQLMSYGIVSKERDRFLFDFCYDMLGTLLTWSLVDPLSALPVNAQDPDTKYRFQYYLGIIKRLRKELNERPLISELRSLNHFLPLPKPSFDIITCETYGTIPGVPQKQPRSVASFPNKANKYGLQVAEKIRLSTYDLIQHFHVDIPSKKTWSWSMFQSVKLDKIPSPVQRYIQRIIYHSHYNEFVRPTICGMERSPNLDIYLSPPVMDVSETPISLHHMGNNSGISSAISSNNLNSSASTSTSSIGMISNPNDLQSSSASSMSQNRPLSFQGDMTQISAQNELTADGMIFSGQPGPIQTMNEMARVQTVSPRGARGGRRKNAVGLANRSQGTTRKKQKQANEQMQLQPPNAQMTASGMNASGYPWPHQPPPQMAHMQQYSTNSQAGMMSQSEDSKMKIHSMILQKRQQAQAASGSGQGMAVPSSATDMNVAYQNVGQGEGSGQFGGSMMIKMENQPMHMEHQQTYAMSQQMVVPDQSSSQFDPQQRVFVQQSQSNPNNMYDSRMMGHQQPIYGQQQYQQRY